MQEELRDPKYLAVDEFVEKPIEPKELLKKVEGLLKARKSSMRGGDDK